MARKSISDVVKPETPNVSRLKTLLMMCIKATKKCISRNGKKKLILLDISNLADIRPCGINKIICRFL